MKEELLNKFLDKSLSYLESAEAFTKEQVPDYVAQLYKWFIINASIDLLTATVIPIVVLIIVYKIFKWTIRKDKKSGDYVVCSSDREGMLAAVASAGIVIFAILVIGGMSSLKKIIKITIAPKVYLVDYLRGKK